MFAFACAADDEAAVRTTVERYFNAWSDKDWKAYGDLFHKDALITHIKNGKAQRFKVKKFLAGQAATDPELKEYADNVELKVDDQIATAWVDWTLSKGDKKIRQGVDVFVFRQHKGQWKIDYLTWY